MDFCLYSSDYEGVMPARYLRHGAQPEEEPAIADMPQLEPYWAAGFSFSRGHFKLRVPYDAYQPMVFQVISQLRVACFGGLCLLWWCEDHLTASSCFHHGVVVVC
jgi:hypothetical protein